MIAWALILPLGAGALLLLLERYSHSVQRVASALACIAGLMLALEILALADRGNVQVSLIGNWPAHVGIVLMLDRLSALMLVLTAILGVVSSIYAARGADREAPHFHALLQFQLLGLNGAFLTGDLFNLFVWFEVLLIASYGLLLHGATAERLQAGLKYVIFNLLASVLFLMGLGLLYGVVGSLNMADVAVKVTELLPQQQALALAAALLLMLVFAIKAALLPLFFWLPGTYGAAAAASAVLFAIMTKVGAYAIVRVFSLVFPDIAWVWVFPVGLLTLTLAAIGAMVAPSFARLAALWTIASAGTLLVGFALGTEDSTAAAINYLIASTLLGALLFLLLDAVRRVRIGGDLLDRGGAMALAKFLAPLLFIAMVAAAALPPSPTFLAKALLLSAAIDTAQTKLVWGVVLISSFLLLLALAHAYSQIVWRRNAGEPATDFSPVDLVMPLLLVVALAMLSIHADGVQRFTQRVAAQLHDPASTIEAVRSAPIKPRPEIAP